jgi:hypothetical protein
MSDIELHVSKNNAELILKALLNCPSGDIKELRRIGNLVDELEERIARLWDPNHDQNAECECNHVYNRHFDGYDDMRAIGCKYCECDTFESK